MSQKQYIRRVRRTLVSGRTNRAAILRDLEEIFSSAAEHGQSTAEVIDRLGPPEDFARAAEEQLGVDRPRLLRRRMLLCALPAGLLAVALFLFSRLYTFISPSSSVGVIGGADGPTAILIASQPLPGSGAVPLLLSLLCAGLAVWAVVRYFRKRG